MPDATPHPLLNVCFRTSCPYVWHWRGCPVNRLTMRIHAAIITVRSGCGLMVAKLKPHLPEDVGDHVEFPAFRFTGCGAEAAVRFATCLLLSWLLWLFFKKRRHVQCKNRSKNLNAYKTNVSRLQQNCSLWLAGGWTFRNEDSQGFTWIDSGVRDVAACSLRSLAVVWLFTECLAL